MMVSFILLSIIAIILLTIFYKYAVYKPDKFPPGKNENLKIDYNIITN